MTDLDQAVERARALLKKPLFTVRQTKSGYTGEVKYLVWKTGKSGGRVSVHAGSRPSMQSDAERLNIGALVLPHAEDPRPYEERHTEAEKAWTIAKGA